MSTESPVVLLGLDQTFLSITNALMFYGRAVSNGAFTKLRFEQQPDVAPDFDPSGSTRWMSSVTMRCYDKPVVDPDSEWVEPLYENTWTETGDSFFDAMESLSSTIEKDLKSRQEAVSMAVMALGLPDPSNVWMSEDPQVAEDDPVDDGPTPEFTG